MNRRYELTYVLAPDATDEQVSEVHAQIEGIVQRIGGQIEKTDQWGRRKLAYEIARHKEGVYVLEVLNGGGDLVKEIDRRLKVMDLIIRHSIIRVDEEQAKVDRVRTRRTDTVRRRRVARGLPPDRQPGEGQREADEEREERFEAGEEMR